MIEVYSKSQFKIGGIYYVTVMEPKGTHTHDLLLKVGEDQFFVLKSTSSQIGSGRKYSIRELGYCLQEQSGGDYYAHIEWEL